MIFASTGVAPSTPVAGTIFFNNETSEYVIYDGAKWRSMERNMSYKYYNILEEGRERNGVRWFGVECSDELMDWLHDTYAVGIDFYINRTLKGVWVDVPEQILTMIKLKW